MSMASFFKPASVAVIGASATPGKLGHVVLKNIIDGGYGGTLYAVNPKGGRILDTPTYISVDGLPEPAELAVLAVPGPAVPALAEVCGQAGVKALVVIAAGFREVGPEGLALEEDLARTVQKYGMRLLGPNCLGLIDPVNKLNASFASGMPPAGEVAVLSQSGAMCTAILDWAAAHRAEIGFSAFVSLGNKAEVTESDLLEAWAEDARTSVVLGYLEGISDGPRFLQAASRLTRQKPFVLIKSGVSEAGADAVGSHTGTLTGSDDVLNAALEKAGVIRANTIEELLDYTTVFADTPLPAGNRVAIVTNAGGPAVLTTDETVAAGLEMAKLGEKTQDVLRKALPAEANVHNPVDCIGDAKANRYQLALSAVLNDRTVDSVIVLLTPQAMTEIAATAEVLVHAARRSDKPVVAAFIGGAAVAPGLAQLHEAKLAAFVTPERAVKALAALSDYAAYRREPASARPAKPAAPKQASQGIMEAAVADGKAALWGREAAAFLIPYGIETPKAEVAASAEAAAEAATKIGYPVVLKVDSEDILHKSDAGGVAAGLGDGEAVREAYGTMLAHISQEFPDARVRGVTVNQQIGEGHEVLVGAKRDVTFGPVVVFGYGGIYVEIFKDVSFGLAPLSKADAAAMVGRTKSAALLRGARGNEPADLTALHNALLAVSQVMVDFPQIQELDVNPLRVFKKGALALDTRILLRHNEAGAANG